MENAALSVSYLETGLPASSLMNSGVRFLGMMQSLILFPPNWAGRRLLSTVTEDWRAADLK
ncbi:MAG: hypothetical protein ACLUIQ_04910 [Dialister invisus]